MTTPAPFLIMVCPQGHGPGIPGTHFCNWCGAALILPTAPAAIAYPAVVPFSSSPIPALCTACGGSGIRLNASENVCLQCRWLRPLTPTYHLDCTVFQWAQDGTAMATLRSMATLSAAARSVSDKVGRPWIETAFNGVRLSPKQMPNVWEQAVLAARLVGMPYMPDVYISGDRMWDTMTYGSDTSAFIVLGTALATNFHDDDLLFLLAREMGHCRAGHALWKTVIRFLTGDTGPRRGLMSDGVLGAISPTKLVESAIEMPLMAWARQAEITADRAGLLAIGDAALVRRVLLAWTLRSSILFRQINIDAWMEQEEDSDAQLTRISEMTSSSTLFITRRLRLLSRFTREPELMRWAGIVRSLRPARPGPTQPARLPVAPSPVPPPKPVSTSNQDSLRLVCAKCRTGLRVPYTVLQGKDALNVRCPQCRNVIPLRKKPAAAPPAAPVAAKPTNASKGV
jgi:Zn-dependent protease with chaperone function